MKNVIVVSSVLIVLRFSFTSPSKSTGMKTAAASEMKNLVVLIFLIFCTLSIDLQGQACWTPFSTSPQYCAGAQVSYNGYNYTNCFCVQGGAPSNSYAPSCSGYGAYWKREGACVSCTNRTVGAASSSPTACINVAMTSITHATTQVTGIASSSGLPSGVSASYASNVITISGTPTQSGTFNYTITPSSSCGTATATGTITVNAALSAGSIGTAQTTWSSVVTNGLRCTNTAS